MKSEALDKLVASGNLVYYDYDNIEEEPSSNFREYEQLTLYFPSGARLKVEAHSSGCRENVCMFLELTKA